jgi:hypothetical protein
VLTSANNKKNPHDGGLEGFEDDHGGIDQPPRGTTEMGLTLRRFRKSALDTNWGIRITDAGHCGEQFTAS